MNAAKASLCAVLLLCTATTNAAVTFDWVVVGNPGNAPDTRYNGISVGAVDHVYQIAKYEVTAGQYTEFLNAVAKADPNGLYSTDMANLSAFGSNILRTGSSGNYTYSVGADWANRPVNYVSFWDAARFVNWLDNGQPTGPQGPGTTEEGAYLNIGNQATFARQPGARFVLPTENEWYKAAYHDKNAGLAASYFDYPTGTNSVPGTDATETTMPGNNANYRIDFGVFALGPPYYRTQVGEYELSDSPYGTFDQGGNAWEWNETVAISSNWRGMLGGGWEAYGSDSLRARDRNAFTPTADRHDAGFRVASLPGLAGDFNDDGRVEAADYVVWRKNNINGSQGYSDWRANFGTGSVPAPDVLVPPSDFRGRSLSDWTLDWGEWAIRTGVGGQTLPDTVNGVRYLPPNFGSSFVADMTIEQGTPLVFSPFFIFGEEYDNGTEDDPNDPFIDQIFQSAMIETTFDGAVVLQQVDSDLAQRMSANRIFSAPIPYTQPQPRGGGVNAVAATFELGIGAIFDNLPVGQHTITNVYSSVLGGPFSTTYNITVVPPGDLSGDSIWVPEPSSLLLTAVGLVAVASHGRCRRS